MKTCLTEIAAIVQITQTPQLRTTRRCTRLTSVCLLSAALLAGCNGAKAPEKKGGRSATPVTTIVASKMPVRVTEKTIGSLESRNDPKIAAEVAGRVLRVLATSGDRVKQGQLLAEIDASDANNQLLADKAEIARLSALFAQQERLLSRQNELVAKNFITKNALDDTAAQRDALKSQLAAAEARTAISRTNLGKTRIFAPYDSAIDQKNVSVGDYVRVGDPLFHLVSNSGLNVHMPFPESSAAVIRPGQAVEIKSPLVPGKTFTAVVEEILPRLTETSRSIDVVARLGAEASLRTGASVDATIVVSRAADVVAVPEQAIVLRPAGKVVYRVEGDQAVQQVITTGTKEGGLVEVLKGLSGGETLVLDGAGFLTDGAKITVKSSGSSSDSGGSNATGPETAPQEQPGQVSPAPAAQTQPKPQTLPPAKP